MATDFTSPAPLEGDMPDPSLVAQNNPPPNPFPQTKPTTPKMASKAPGPLGYDPDVPTGEAFLRGLPPGSAALVKAVAEGRHSVYDRGSPTAQQLFQAVTQYDPTYTDARAKMRAAFTSGLQGRQINNLSTAAVHLDQLGGLANALSNGDMTTVNNMKNWFKTQFGNADPTNFDALKEAVLGELGRGLTGVGLTNEEHAALNNIRNLNSPAQLAGAINTHLHTVGAKLQNFQEQYDQAIPGDPVYGVTTGHGGLVTPTAYEVLVRHKAIGAPGGSPVKVSTRAERDALPSGAQYIGPDGHVATKP